MVQASDDAEKISAAFTKALDGLLEDSLLRGKRIVDAVEFDTVTVSGSSQLIGWAAIDGYFVLSVGDAAAKQVIAGIREQDQGLNGNAAVRKMLAGSKVERPMLRTFAAIDQIVARVPLAEKFWGTAGHQRGHCRARRVRLGRRWICVAHAVGDRQAQWRAW